MAKKDSVIHQNGIYEICKSVKNGRHERNKPALVDLPWGPGTLVEVIEDNGTFGVRPSTLTGEDLSCAMYVVDNAGPCSQVGCPVEEEEIPYLIRPACLDRVALFIAPQTAVSPGERLDNDGTGKLVPGDGPFRVPFNSPGLDGTAEKPCLLTVEVCEC